MEGKNLKNLEIEKNKSVYTLWMSPPVNSELHFIMDTASSYPPPFYPVNFQFRQLPVWVGAI